MRIIVSSEEEKEILIAESKYVHDFWIKIRGKKGRVINWKGLDSDKAGVLMHIYTAPEIIIVENKMPS